MENISLDPSKSCFFLKAHFLSCPVLTHLSKMMVSLRGNTGILWRQLVPYCCPHRFLRHSGALTSVYVINRIPSSVIAGLSPFERLYGSTPYSSELLVFGSTCFVLLAKVERDKLSKKKICYLCVCFWVMALNKRDIDAMTQKHRSFESLGMSPSGKRFLFILSLVFVHLLFQILSPSCSLILF